MPDEFDQYRVPASTPPPVQQDEFAQYKANNMPGTISGQLSSIGPSKTSVNNNVPTTKWQGTFLERAESQIGEDLRNPMNLLNLLPGISYHQGSTGYSADKAETAGHVGYGILASLPFLGGRGASHESIPPGETINPSIPPPPAPGSLRDLLPKGNQAPPTLSPTEALARLKANAAPEVQPVPLKIPNQSQKLPYSGPRTPPMETSQSGTIAQHGYHADSSTMVVEFKNGKVYEYRGVPQEVYNAYQQSESQGSFFAQNIKGRYQTNFRGIAKPK